MTLVSNSPHVASLLRINISKLGWRLTGLTDLRYSPHVASLLRVNISKLGCALQANFIYAIALTSLRSSGSISLSSVAPYRLTSLRAIEKRAHSSLRLGLLDSSPDPLHAELLLR